MHAVVVGAGGGGGYFGARLIEAGGDVTCLVMPRRPHCGYGFAATGRVRRELR